VRGYKSALALVGLAASLSGCAAIESISVVELEGQNRLEGRESPAALKSGIVTVGLNDKALAGGRKTNRWRIQPRLRIPLFYDFIHPSRFDPGPPPARAQDSSPLPWPSR
jgi:hypothetical protein